MTYQIRPMRPGDLDTVLRVQAACYPPAMQEAGSVVLDRLRAAPATCIVAGDAGEGVCGYLFAYPSRHGRVTPLGASFEVAAGADTLYLHDLAVDPCAHGRGLARALVDHLWMAGRAAGFERSALVSVQDSARFWRALGYAAAPTRDPSLGTYPPGALYMVRTL